MIYSFRVTLPGIKGFFRVYHLRSDNSLYSFHKQMRADMEFPQDQLILFKAFAGDGSTVIARFGLFDLGNGAVDDISIEQVVEKNIASFQYFYDVTNKKSVIITFEGEVEEDKPHNHPYLAEIKGPNPIEFENGYVAFEDLPDDQRHLPSESDKNRKKSGLDSLLEALKEEASDTADEDEDIKLDDEDFDDEDDDEEEEIDGSDEDGIEIFDGSEDLTL